MDDLAPAPPPPLHEAAMSGLPLPVVKQRIRQSPGIDAIWSGRTALWEAVMHRHHEIARFLAACGADPWHPLIGGWSPARLALAGPEPGLFGEPDAHLTAAELAAVARARRLVEAVGEPEIGAGSIACLSKVDSAEVAGRLRAVPIEIADFAEWAADPWSQGMTDQEIAHTVGVTDVPGGCVLVTWAGDTAADPGLLALLTPGTSGYAIRAGRGTAVHHGRVTGTGLRPGGGRSRPDDTAQEVLRTYLYYEHPVAYCCDAAGLTPDGPQPFTGPPTRLLHLPPLPVAGLPLG